MTEARCSGVETEIQGDKAHCLKKKNNAFQKVSEKRF